MTDLSVLSAPAPSDQMNAIIVEGGAGDASTLKLARIPVPQPKPGELMILVRAAGVNAPDLMQRSGRYPPPPGASHILGLEVAGEVVAAAGRWRVGDRVCALLGGGGYAEYAVCDPRHALPIPAGLGWREAAALPETAFTVYANVFEHGSLKSGETLLIHGATSGIGVAAIQFGKAAGAKVIATARGADKAAKAHLLGADIAIDATAQDFSFIAKQAGGVDVVLDMVGGAYFEKELDALNIGGRIVFIANRATVNPSLPIVTIMQKRAIVTGSTLRSRSADEKARLATQIESVVWPWIAEGRVKPVLDRVFPLFEAALAHRVLESGTHVGKVVLANDD